MRSRTSRRPMGSSPDIGSSRKTTLGSCRIACAMPTRCSMPLENFRSCTPPTSAVRHVPALHLTLRDRLSRIHSGKLPVVLQQFAGGQVVVEVRLLGQKSDLRLHARIVDFHPQNAGRASGGEDQPHQHLERGGLAGAVRSEEAENLAFLDRQVQRAQGMLRPLAPEAHGVGFFQTKNFDCSHGRSIEMRSTGCYLVLDKNYRAIVRLAGISPQGTCDYQSKRAGTRVPAPSGVVPSPRYWPNLLTTARLHTPGRSVRLRRVVRPRPRVAAQNSVRDDAEVPNASLVEGNRSRTSYKRIVDATAC